MRLCVCSFIYCTSLSKNFNENRELRTDSSLLHPSMAAVSEHRHHSSIFFLFFYKLIFYVVVFQIVCPIITDDDTFLLQVDAARHHLGSRTVSSLQHSSALTTSRHRHKWVGPCGFLNITVALHGRADFTSVQAAVDSVPENNTKNVFIKITAGCYKEKVVVPHLKPYISFIGEGRNSTVIEWHDRASDRGANGEQLRTYRTASVTIYADYFSARNISFKNTAPAPLPGMEGRQAAAFRISGDKAYFSGCGFYGAQDTLCDDAGRHYFKNCYIEGSIDFIFGNGRSMYKDCQLHSIAKRFGSIAAQDRNSPEEKTGFAFLNCRVTGSGPLYVGRAMGQYSRIVYAYTYFDDLVAHGGWDDWDHVSNKNKTAFFGVYRCWGPGAPAVRGVSWAQELDYDTAHPFLAKSFVNGRHWISPADA